MEKERKKKNPEKKELNFKSKHKEEIVNTLGKPLPPYGHKDVLKLWFKEEFHVLSHSLLRTVPIKLLDSKKKLDELELREITRWTQSATYFYESFLRNLEDNIRKTYQDEVVDTSFSEPFITYLSHFVSLAGDLKFDKFFTYFLKAKMITKNLDKDVVLELFPVPSFLIVIKDKKSL